MSAHPNLVDVNGRPLTAKLNGETCGPRSAHVSGDRFIRELSMWLPMLKSADSEWLPDRNLTVARTRDLVRNHGFASGAVQAQLDTMIGSGLRLAAKPDYRTLGQSADWAREWSREVERQFWLWAYDINNECDVTRTVQFPGLIGQATRSFLTDGDIFAVVEFLPDRRYATAINIIDPDRVSNPHGASDSDTLRGGVELDRFGAPLAYHIRQSHPHDVGVYGARLEWNVVPRLTSFGRPQVIHVFDRQRANQHRGKGLFTPILAKLKMLDTYQKAELESAVINTLYAMVISSEYPHTEVAEAMGMHKGPDGQLQTVTPLKQYLNDKTDWHQVQNIVHDGVKVPHLFPGEELKAVAPEHPQSQFAAFADAVLREIAAGLNMSWEQITRDYSKTNYSSARASMLEAWRFVLSRRTIIGQRLATPIYRLWLEEAIDRGDIDLPRGAPAFDEAITAYTKCNWQGPKREQIDPLRETKADASKLQLNLTTLEELCAVDGRDWEEVLEQRAREQQKLAELGLPVTAGTDENITTNQLNAGDESAPLDRGL